MKKLIYMLFIALVITPCSAFGIGGGMGVTGGSSFDGVSTDGNKGLVVEGAVSIGSSNVRAEESEVVQIIHNTTAGYDTMLVTTNLTVYVNRGSGLVADPTPFNSED